MSEQKDVSTDYQPQDGDLYIQEVKAGRFTIHRYRFESWEQLGAGHSEQDIKTLTVPMQFLWESKGFRRYYRPTGTKDVSTDWQTRSEELEKLVRDLLLFIHERMPFTYQTSPRAVDLQDRAAALGIVPEL